MFNRWKTDLRDIFEYVVSALACAAALTGTDQKKFIEGLKGVFDAYAEAVQKLSVGKLLVPGYDPFKAARLKAKELREQIGF